MPFARHLQLATLDFMIGNPDPLPKANALLGMAAAMAADGHVAETANVLTYVLQEHPEPEHVREIIIQTHLFAGFPRALNALDAFDQAIGKAKVDRSRLRTEATECELSNEALISRAKDRWNEIYGPNDMRVADRSKALSPDLAFWGLLHGYGRVLSRPGPDAIARQIGIVSALIPMDAQPQLKGHLQGYLNLGGTDEQLWKLLGILRSLFEAPKLFDITTRTFESVLGKKKSDLSFEEEQKLRWS